MKFKQGDKVKFLNDVGGGIIQRFDGNIAYVESWEGFEVPVKADELIMDEPAEEMSEDYETTGGGSHDYREDIIDELFNSPSETIIKGNDEGQLYFALFPVYDEHGYIREFELYLINDSNYKVAYTVSSKGAGKKRNHIHAGIVEANTKMQFGYQEEGEEKTIKSYHFQVLYYQLPSYKALSPLQIEIPVDPLDLYDPNQLDSSDFFDEKVRLFPLHQAAFQEAVENLSEADFENMKLSKDQPQKSAKQVRRKSTSELREVDLHIEELLDDHRGMSNKEILDVQLARFKKELEQAIQDQVRKIVFIHGIGNGKLRFELRKYLEDYYPKLKYQDASFQEYGFGATMVFLR